MFIGWYCTSVYYNGCNYKRIGMYVYTFIFSILLIAIYLENIKAISKLLEAYTH